MAGLDDLTSEANERWAKAERYAHGFADNGMGEALRVYYTRYFPAGVILYAGALALVGSLLSGDEPTNWRLVLQAGSFLFALLAAIAGLIYNSKRVKPRAELGKNLSITIGLEVDEQKYLRRAITGKEPPPQDPVRLAVARSVAVQSRKTQATNLLTVPLHSYGLGGLFEDLSFLWMGITAVFLVTTILFAREFRQTGRFLAATAP
ncbi:hypothetical protein [Arthrobacter ruber]|uniref:hypothetical protein n=1 Tax=Arthrobacter ruber TaxID=1258893 RepID=UPI0012FFF5EB|nr:hypothetical protein [Arthrobacter ruber]